MILQAELSGNPLRRNIIDLVEQPSEIGSLMAAARQMARPDAAAVTVDLIASLLKEKTINMFRHVKKIHFIGSGHRNERYR